MEVPQQRGDCCSLLTYGVYLVGAAGGSQFKGLVLDGVRQHKQRKCRRRTKTRQKRGTSHIALPWVTRRRPCPTLSDRPQRLSRTAEPILKLAQTPVHTCGLITVLEYKPLAAALNVLILGAANRAGTLAPSP